jgi:hypothetical protein
LSVATGISPLRKSVERYTTEAGEVGINPVERGAVNFAPIEGHPHAGQQQLGSARQYLGDHRIEIGANDRRLDSAQRIIGAQFEDHQVGLLPERAVDAGEAPGSGVARYPLVDDPHHCPLCSQRRLELGRKGILSPHPPPPRICRSRRRSRRDIGRHCRQHMGRKGFLGAFAGAWRFGQLLETKASAHRGSRMYIEAMRAPHDLGLWLMGVGMLVLTLVLWSRGGVTRGDVI